MVPLLCALALCAGPSRPSGDAQDLVYLSPTGPVLIRLHLQADGVPLRRRFEALMREVFDSLDKNKDGVLSKDEAAAMPRLGGPNALVFNIGGNIAMRPPARGAVRLLFEGMKERYAQQGVVPFKLGDAGGPVYLVWGGTAPRSAAQITAKLFARLDTNKDGKLDKKELAAAERVLLEFDADEDELVSVGELMDEPPATASPFAQVAFTAPAGGDTAPGFHAVTDDASRRALAAALATAPGALARLRPLDRDRDGKISAAELAGLAALAPDVELNVEVNSKGGVTVSPTPSAPVSKAARLTKGPGGLVLNVGSAEVAFGAPAVASGGLALALDAASNYAELFKAADADNNGYIDRKEAMRGLAIAGDFDAIDADHDGKIFQKELVSYMKRVEALSSKLRGATLALSIKEQGQGLFDLLDLNRDGVLGVRELRRAPELLRRLKLERLAAADVPRQFRAGFSPGGPDPGGLGAIRAFSVVDVARPARRGAEKGPMWFRRMDLNRDGDVSRSEWLGTREEFAKIDTDGDGLISPEEAEAYHEKLTSKKGK